MPKDKKAILFDLDGTVINSKEGIFNSIDYTLNKLNMEKATDEIKAKFIGPAIGYSFKTLYGFTEEEAERAVDIYREYYAETGIFEMEAYEGLERVLALLKAQGRKIAIATKKPEMFAKRIITYLDFDKYFDLVCGAMSEEADNSKSHIIERAYKGLGLSKEDALMIGDTKFDIIGAKGAGVMSLGVGYGFGTKEELKENGADFYAENTDELYNMF